MKINDFQYISSPSSSAEKGSGSLRISVSELNVDFTREKHACIKDYSNDLSQARVNPGSLPGSTEQRGREPQGVSEPSAFLEGDQLSAGRAALGVRSLPPAARRSGLRDELEK